MADNNGRFPMHMGSQTYWIGQRGDRGMYSKDKFSILNKASNKYLGTFEEGDIVPSSKCPEIQDDDPAFLKYGTDYEANNHNKTAHGLQEDRTGFLAQAEQPARMVSFYEEAVYELMYSMPVPEYM
ncbi:MAG: hypothetical protein MK132_16220 [Lentisphaerales bacterium]|nr:hypothetical protein [Lentisphaerales bacterium]